MDSDLAAGQHYPNLNNWSQIDKCMQSGEEPYKVDSR